MENQTTQRRRVKNKPTIKRLLANKCERERVRKINEAFEILKTHIPYCDSGRIRTKLDVLKFAIDYIQILTKMVSQSEAATLLRTPRLENESAFMLSTEGSETESLRSSSEMFSVRLDEASAFPFDDQQSQLGITSPTLSDDEVFFGADLTNDENLTGQYPAWSDNQSGFHQAQTYHHNEQHTPLRTYSFDEQPQDVSPFWLNQANGIARAVMSLNGSTTPPSDSNNNELAEWLHL
ncbi:twist-related -like [Paramuricea clavata]|uniref:Twist-related -like n=1 Tax=Paramuricea clavata TaxID=317549 RepID=A0A6S7HI59_PARCT|nr:twist-related -like [Paramuricea clavata]